MRFLIPLGWLLAGLCTAITAAAQVPLNAGTVKRVVGMVTLERGGQRLTAEPGQAVLAGDQLHTGRDSAASVTMADDTLLTAGANAHLSINAFNYDSTTQDGNIALKLWRGTLSVVTGLIGKKSPEKVNLQTRTLVLGVRGTEFIVDVPGEAP